MADVLSGLLQGVDRGFSNGLDLYKTVQDEARQKRLEQYQLKRDAIADQRYGGEIEYRDKRDSVLDTRYENDRAWEREKYKLEQERLAAAAAATAAYRQQQLGIRAAEYKLKVNKENRAIQKERQAEWNGRVKAGVDAFSTAFKDNPDAAQDVYAADVYARIGVNQKVAQAQGFELDAETASRLYAMPRPDGTYVIGQHTEKGFEPYDADPESDGEQALVMPNDVFARTFAGTEGSQSLQARDAKVEATRQVVGAANAQLNADNADVLAKAAEAEQAAFRAENELATLEKTPAYVSHTDYRGVKLTRVNYGGLGKVGVKTPQELEAKKRSLASVAKESRARAGQLLANQDRAKTSAAETLSNNLGYLDQATQGVDNAEVRAVLSNTLNQIHADNGQTIQPGLSVPEATAKNQKRSTELYNVVNQAVNREVPKGLKAKEFFKASQGKMTASIVAAMENNGGAENWLATPMGNAAMGEITAQLTARGIDYGAGFLAKMMASQGNGAQIDVGLQALESKVVRSLPAQDREPIARLAAQFIGDKTDDPEAAIMMAIKAYNEGDRPKSLADVGR